MAPPPPLHIPAIPYFPPFYFKTVINDNTILAPDILLLYLIYYPIGCPKATAPPLTFTFSTGISKSFILANTVAAKASLISWKSIWEIFNL